MSRKQATDATLAKLRALEKSTLKTMRLKNLAQVCRQTFTAKYSTGTRFSALARSCRRGVPRPVSRRRSRRSYKQSPPYRVLRLLLSFRARRFELATTVRLLDGVCNSQSVRRQPRGFRIRIDAVGEVGEGAATHRGRDRGVCDETQSLRSF